MQVSNVHRLTHNLCGDKIDNSHRLRHAFVDVYADNYAINQLFIAK